MGRGGVTTDEGKKRPVGRLAFFAFRPRKIQKLKITGREPCATAVIGRGALRASWREKGEEGGTKGSA